MNQSLFDRSTGTLSPEGFAQIQTSQRVHAIQPTPKLRFDGGEKEAILANSAEIGGPSGNIDRKDKIWAHQGGVNALSLDIDNKILVSGGADSSVKLWNLEDHSSSAPYTLKPTATLPRTASAHRFGITHLSFFPFDSAAFLSSSYDHHLKLYATETLTLSADFDLNSIIYTHALSPIASHLLVACATQNPTVRLIDLRSGSSTHSLAGHHGALLAVSWSPKVEHILASGGTDGTVRLWDIRKSSGSLGILDAEDSLGVTGIEATDTRRRQNGKAHQGAVNAITWIDDGSYIVTAGHDERMRVWDAATGANTLANFGPTLRNSHLSHLPLVTSPTAVTPPGKGLLFYPNEKELLVFELHEGRILKRLRVPGAILATVRSRSGERNVKSRITALMWRGQTDGLFSAHTDGQIRGWLPRTSEDDNLDLEEEEAAKQHIDDDADASGKRKRQELDDLFRDLTRQKITFG